MAGVGKLGVSQVGQGKVQELAAQAGAVAGLAAASQGADDGAAESRHAAEEARMLQLLAERAAILEQAKVRQPLQRHKCAAVYSAKSRWLHCIASASQGHLPLWGCPMAYFSPVRRLLPIDKHPPATWQCTAYHADLCMSLLQLDAAGRGKRARRQINYATADSPSVAVSGAGRSRASGSNVTTPLSSPDSALRPVNGAVAMPLVRRLSSVRM
jgi:hypothetical protein